VRWRLLRTEIDLHHRPALFASWQLARSPARLQHAPRRFGLTSRRGPHRAHAVMNPPLAVRIIHASSGSAGNTLPANCRSVWRPSQVTCLRLLIVTLDVSEQSPHRCAKTGLRVYGQDDRTGVTLQEDPAAPNFSRLHNMLVLGRQFSPKAGESAAKAPCEGDLRRDGRARVVKERLTAGYLDPRMTVFLHRAWPPFYPTDFPPSAGPARSFDRRRRPAGTRRRINEISVCPMCA